MVGCGLALLVTVATAAPGAAALTNWQSALDCFKQAGARIGDNKLAEAATALSAGSTNFAAPYNSMAAAFAGQLESIRKSPADPKDPKRTRATIQLCAALRAYDVAVRLQAASNTAEDLADDPAYAWRLFESGNLAGALAAYRRKLQDEAVESFVNHYREQIRLVEERPANLTNVSFSLRLVKEHYLRGFEEKADVLGALQELHRVLPHAKSSKESVAVIAAMIDRLSQLNDEAGRAAWEDRILNGFKQEPEACANVLLERGLRAFGRTNLAEALTLCRKVCSEYPDTAAYGDAQYTVGLIFQREGKFEDAIAEFQKIFPSKVRDHDLDLEKSDDYKNYRHRTALRISECYAARKDFAQALAYAEQARDRYLFLSWCKTCLAEYKAGLERRLAELRAELAKASAPAQTP